MPGAGICTNAGHILAFVGLESMIDSQVLVAYGTLTGISRGCLQQTAISLTCFVSRA
jgi:hypothetical protein